MTTTQTDAIMALADRYAFHIPGSQHSDEARAVLLAALQEQAPKRLWGMAGFNPPLPNVGEKYTSIHEDDLGDHVTVTGIANASSPNIAYVFLSWDDGHYGERAIDEFWQEYMLVQTNEQAQEPDCATTGVCVRSGLYASPPGAVPVVEQMVEALKGVVVGADESWTQACKELNSMGITSVPVSNASAGLINRQIEAIDVARTAIAAGQKFIKENGE